MFGLNCLHHRIVPSRVGGESGHACLGGRGNAHRFETMMNSLESKWESMR